MKDNQKDDEIQPGNVAVIAQEEKGLPQTVELRTKGWKVIKIKPKEQAEAERLFFLFFPEASHWEAPSILLPFNPANYLPDFKQNALAILSTGIIEENGLKGHAGYPVNQRDLIIALIDTDYQYRNITFFPEDILKQFDSNFDSMAALAHLSGATDFQIKQAMDDLKKLRDKISLSVSQGKFPPNWRELIKVELISSWRYHAKSQAQSFAIVFLEYVPQASANKIAPWVNVVLKSLGRPTASKSKLREYIKKERQLRPWLPQEPPKNTL